MTIFIFRGTKKDYQTSAVSVRIRIDDDYENHVINGNPEDSSDSDS